MTNNNNTVLLNGISNDGERTSTTTTTKTKINVSPEAKSFCAVWHAIALETSEGSNYFEKWLYYSPFRPIVVFISQQCVMDSVLSKTDEWNDHINAAFEGIHFIHDTQRACSRVRVNFIIGDLSISAHIFAICRNVVQNNG